MNPAVSSIWNGFSYTKNFVASSKWKEVTNHEPSKTPNVELRRSSVEEHLPSFGPWYPSSPSPDDHSSLHVALSAYPPQPSLFCPNHKILFSPTCPHNAMITGCRVSNKMTNFWRTEISSSPSCPSQPSLNPSTCSSRASQRLLKIWGRAICCHISSRLASLLTTYLRPFTILHTGETYTGLASKSLPLSSI